MKIQTKATSVLERTSHYLRAGIITEKPAWYDVVESFPPNANLVKKPSVFNNKLQLQDPTQDLYTKKSNGLYKTRLSTPEKKNANNSIARVPKLQFVEDELRNVFYHQHPWEFSRPKTLIETSGDGNKDCDWNNLLQLNKPLDGESVVQRTLHLLKTKEETDMFKAYDKARFEFYRLRMEEELSSTVSREESTMYGAVFASSNIKHGVKEEQGYVDLWAKVASDKTKALNATMGNKVQASVGIIEESGTKSIWDEPIVPEGSQTVQKDSK